MGLDKIGLILICVALVVLLFTVGYLLFDKGMVLLHEIEVFVDKTLTHKYRVYIKDREDNVTLYVDVAAKSVEDARFKGLLQVGYMYKVMEVERMDKIR